VHVALLKWQKAVEERKEQRERIERILAKRE